MKNILIVDEICNPALEILESNGDYEVRLISNEDFTPDMLKKTEGLIVKERTHVNLDFLAKADDLKVIVVASGGYDNIDLNATRARGIKVAYCPQATAASTAELTMMYALMLSRRYLDSQKAMQDQNWSRRNYLGHDLFMKSIGLVGLGNVGSRVAEFAKGFKMVVAAYDPYVDDSVFKKLDVVRANSLQDLLRMSNVISLHLPATRVNKNMVNDNFFEMMQDKSYLINTSRGQLVDEKCLSRALKAGKLAGAALDCFKEEPLDPDSILFSVPNLIMTPHMGSVTSNTLNKVSHQAVSKLKEFFEKNELRNEVNESV